MVGIDEAPDKSALIISLRLQLLNHHQTKMGQGELFAGFLDVLSCQFYSPPQLQKNFSEKWRKVETT
jgi:hypothetical protein